MNPAHEVLTPAEDLPMTTDQRPVHERIAADVREDILSGAIPSGVVLRPADLSRRFGAAAASVCQALRLLEGEFLIAPRAEGDVVVRGHRRQTMRPVQGMTAAGPGEPFPWIAEARRRGVDACNTLLEVAVLREPPARIANALALSAGQPVVLRHLMLSFDEEPAALIKAYFPYDIAAGTPITGPGLIRGGIPTLLARRGHPALRCVDSISAQVPTQEQYTLLRLPEAVPLLRTFRVVYGTGDRPVFVNDTVEAAHLYELQYEFSPAASL
ncbi:GntR family transcriptional regulator [Streptomyces sp. NPDC001339]|uniref:GntR family transcriptional regulator n=1 Tax=Streptomyces sp. NPDC001339 TaxID=3364563 RepID=UPI0036769C36